METDHWFNYTFSADGGGGGTSPDPSDLLEIKAGNIDLASDTCNAVNGDKELLAFDIDFVLKMDIPVDIVSPYVFTINAEVIKI